MNIEEAYDITAPITTRKRAIDAAQHELLTQAVSTDHQGLANMLRICAKALPNHPDARNLCARNHDRLWLAIDRAGDTDGPSATEIHLAALAFDRAADILGKVQ